MKAFAILRPPTAFSLSPGTKKRPRDKNDRHLKFIRSLPCAICGTHKHVEAAHLRMGARAYGKPETPMGVRPDDKWSTPLCAFHHRTGPDAQHTMGEEQFWARHRINPFILATSLWAASGDDEAADQIITTTRPASG